MDATMTQAPMRRVQTPAMPELPDFDALNREMVQADDLDATAQKSFKYCYWRKVDGFIVIAPAWPSEFMGQVRQKWEPLEQYGEFLLTQSNPGGWRPSVEPWRGIFAKGGAKEFSVEEILEHGWHRTPPYRGIVFPQLAGVEIPADVKCPACGKLFLKVEHLAKHESVAHRDSASTKAFAREVAESQSAFTGPLGEIVKMMLAQQDALNQRIEKQGQALELLMERMAPAEKAKK